MREFRYDSRFLYRHVLFDNKCTILILFSFLMYKEHLYIHDVRLWVDSGLRVAKAYCR